MLTGKIVKVIKFNKKTEIVVETPEFYYHFCILRFFNLETLEFEENFNLDLQDKRIILREFENPNVVGKTVLKLFHKNHSYLFCVSHKLTFNTESISVK